MERHGGCEEEWTGGSEEGVGDEQRWKMQCLGLGQPAREKNGEQVALTGRGHGEVLLLASVCPPVSITGSLLALGRGGGDL